MAMSAEGTGRQRVEEALSESQERSGEARPMAGALPGLKAAMPEGCGEKKK
jgi:hypothetical protein